MLHRPRRVCVFSADIGAVRGARQSVLINVSSLPECSQTYRQSPNAAASGGAFGKTVLQAVVREDRESRRTKTFLLIHTLKAAHEYYFSIPHKKLTSDAHNPYKRLPRIF